MIDKIFSLFDEDNQFKQVWQLKLIKFDTDLDQDVKPYQRYLAISHIVEDTKGNPGIRGHFYATNLRFVWHGANDRDINLSIGLDTIVNTFIKPVMGGGLTKHILFVKTQSPSGNKYQFKFSIFAQKQLYIFKKAIQIFNQAISTKAYRSIDTSVKVDSSQKYIPFVEQQIFNKYTEGKYYQSQKVFECDVMLTNVRMIILILNPNKNISYGIPWIMIESFQKTTYWEHPVIKLRVRGMLKDKDLYLRFNKAFAKFQAEFNSLAMTYGKNPILGINCTNAICKDGVQLNSAAKQDNFQQTFQTKINIKRTKNTYEAENAGVGNLNDTFYNEELGIMMQKLPLGVTRSSLWQILG